MKLLKKIILLTGLALCFGFVALPATEAVASPFDPIKDACTQNPDTALCKASPNDLPAILKNIVNILLYILAAISVVFIILAGVYYTTSGGDAAGVKRAKDTLLYSVVGLVVAILAYSIVNFVITNIKA